MEIEEGNGKNNKRKKPLDINWEELLPRDVDNDDRPPELVVTSEKKTEGWGDSQQSQTEDSDVQSKSDHDIQSSITRIKQNIMKLGPKLPDKGEKLKANLQRHEDELERRKKHYVEKGNNGSEGTVCVSDQNDDGASCGKKKADQKSVASPNFAKLFFKKLEEDPKDSRTVNAFAAELSCIHPCQGRNMKHNGQVSSKGRSGIRVSSRPTSAVELTNSRPQNISNDENKNSHSATISPRQFFGNKPSEVNNARDSPSRNLRPRHRRTYNLVDEEPLVQNTIQHGEKLEECMREIKVYYPSRDDPDSIEVNYTDMACLAPEASLSSPIMNFYIRYLQQSTLSSEGATCNYHIFNTYFYNKLQKLSYSEDSFLKFRKWWKRVNIFEKAYVLLPIHESAHWSLVIVSIPTKEDELGPILLHLDSLGLHDSRSLFDNIKKFLKEEWSYVRNSKGPLDLPIEDEIWENFDHRMMDKRVTVPQQRNDYDCGLFVLFYMECFIKQAPDRLRKKDLSMFSKQWFRPEEASNLRVRIHNLLVEEFKKAKGLESSTV